MTDPSPADAPSKALFEMVPTSDAYLELVEQVTTLQEHVGELQAAQPATSGDGADDESESAQIAAGMESLSTRIDRHRAEIENIKKVINQLIKFLGSPSSPIPAATADATGDTITTTATGGL